MYCVVLHRYFAGVIVWLGIILALIIVLAGIAYAFSCFLHFQTIFSLVSAFAFFQFYCFETGNNAIPNFFNNNTLTSITDLQSFLNSSEQIAAAGCQFTNPLRDFFASNAPWFQYQKETWLAGGLIIIIITIPYSRLFTVVKYFVQKIFDWIKFSTATRQPNIKSQLEFVTHVFEALADA